MSVSLLSILCAVVIVMLSAISHWSLSQRVGRLAALVDRAHQSDSDALSNQLQPLSAALTKLQLEQTATLSKVRRADDERSALRRRIAKSASKDAERAAKRSLHADKQSDKQRDKQRAWTDKLRHESEQRAQLADELAALRTELASTRTLVTAAQTQLAQLQSVQMKLLDAQKVLQSQLTLPSPRANAPPPSAAVRSPPPKTATAKRIDLRNRQIDARARAAAARAARALPKPMPVTPLDETEVLLAGNGTLSGNATLVFAINTVARPKAEYLSDTVKSIRDEVQRGEYLRQFVAKIVLLVVSFSPPAEHAAFAALSNETSSDNRFQLIVVDYSSRRRMDPHADDQPPVNDKHNPGMRPGPGVRQQTNDLMSLLNVTIALNADYAIVTEDDATLCPDGLKRLTQNIMLLEATQKHRWSMLRSSVGFLGIVLPSERLRHLELFLQRYYLTKPPDLLLSEWQHGVWEGGVRQISADNALPKPLPREPMSIEQHHMRSLPPKTAANPYVMHYIEAYNQFLHIGKQSSLGHPRSAAATKCKALIRNVFDPREAFLTKTCWGSQISPCYGKALVIS